MANEAVVSPSIVRGMYQFGVPVGWNSFRGSRAQCDWLLANGNSKRLVLGWFICHGLCCIDAIGQRTTPNLGEGSNEQADLRYICPVDRRLLVAPDIGTARVGSFFQKWPINLATHGNFSGIGPVRFTCPASILLFWPKSVGYYFTGGMYSRPKFFRYSFSGGNPTLVRRWSTCSSSSTGKRKNFPLDSALDCS